MNHTGTVVLRTPRLLLRPFAPGDAEAVFRNWAGDAEVGRFLSWPTHAGIETTKRVLAEWAESYPSDTYYHWGIELGGTLIGAIHAYAVNDDAQSCEIGYCMGKAWWGMGVMSEAAEAVLGHMFGFVGMNRVSATHDVENPASGGVMRKIGMTREGVMRKARRRKDGSFGDIAICAILREEWEERK